MSYTDSSNYFVDTHCHLNLVVNPQFNVPLDEQQIKAAQEIITRAHQAHVQYIINIGTGIIDTKNCIALAQRYPELFVVAGLHPNDLTDSWRQEFAQISTLAKNAQKLRIVGIGETGIDCYRSREKLSYQVDAFKAHIELALEHNLAIVVHTRKAAQETLDILELYKNNLQKLVMHCYPYDLAIAKKIISWGGFLGIGGPVTYPGSTQLQEVVREIDLKHIVLETDAPYLPPQHMRGKQNDPAQLRAIAQEVAHIKDSSLEEVARVTSTNAHIIFNIPDYIKHTLTQSP